MRYGYRAANKKERAQLGLLDRQRSHCTVKENGINLKLTPLWILPGFYFLFIACELLKENGEPENTGDTCTELAASAYNPVTINNLLAFAHDSSDTYFVIDEAEHRKRAFISNKDTLYRRKVTGSSILSERYYFLSLEGDDRIIFRKISEIWSDMYFCTGKPCKECDSILSSKTDRNSKIGYQEKMEEGWRLMCNYLDSARPDCQSLSLAEKTELQRFAVRNFPPTTRIEYLASLRDSNYLIVSREEYDWDGNAVIHYGKPGDLKLRKLISFIRARDGGSTWIRFIIGSQEAEAYFGVKLKPTEFSPGNSHLEISGDTLQLELLKPSKEALSELGLNCTHEIR